MTSALFLFCSASPNICGKQVRVGLDPRVLLLIVFAYIGLVFRRVKRHGRGWRRNSSSTRGFNADERSTGKWRERCIHSRVVVDVTFRKQNASIYAVFVTAANDGLFGVYGTQGECPDCGGPHVMGFVYLFAA